MKIAKIEAFPIKIRKDHVYLGNSSALDTPYDYYLRPSYRCPYSKNMETLLVKITTDDGIEGWGEALAPVVPEVAGIIIERMFTPFLLGREATDIDVIWNLLYDTMRDRGYFTGFMVDAVSAVDIALWDIAGKYYKQPIYKLLGGAYRTNVPAYISGLPVESLEEKVNLAREWKAKGFTAIKLHIGYGMQEDIRIMTALREALGLDFGLMIDAHWNYTVADAVQLGRAMGALHVRFLECPLDPEDIDGYAQLSHSLDIPVALGESDRTHFQYREHLVRNSCDILQPDVGRTGITELMRITKLADTFHKKVAPHLSVGQGVCIAATLQCCAAMYNFYGLQEYQPSILPVANEFLNAPITCENGIFAVPDGFGLGISLDEDRVRHHAVKL
ncbi:MAG: mandelate racemase/muconate lactonizing enzyme family protein [Ruminococcaceae bacterium]|nr:mandelate racemase/muconate lactonizing enzyme family protein [Oscillospiraceae bacterium]